MWTLCNSLSIVASRHPSLEKNLVDKLVIFNTQVHFDVVEKREFAERHGSPWEFNLRNVFVPMV
jgi:midasin (ATPase involved in ribosome maturation)